VDKAPFAFEIAYDSDCSQPIIYLGTRKEKQVKRGRSNSILNSVSQFYPRIQQTNKNGKKWMAVNSQHSYTLINKLAGTGVS